MRISIVVQALLSKFLSLQKLNCITKTGLKMQSMPKILKASNKGIGQLSFTFYMLTINNNLVD